MFNKIGLIVVLVMLALLATACDTENGGQQNDSAAAEEGMGAGTMGPGEVIELSGTPQPVSPEELQRREEILDRTHGTGPELPTGKPPADVTPSNPTEIEPPAGTNTPTP